LDPELAAVSGVPVQRDVGVPKHHQVTGSEAIAMSGHRDSVAIVVLRPAECLGPAFLTPLVGRYHEDVGSARTGGEGVPDDVVAAVGGLHDRLAAVVLGSAVCALEGDLGTHG
jgi:hypothetical protein